MNTYTFSTLNDKEFEQIVKDLLNAKFKLNLQSFKTGRDKGIDLRYSTAGNNNYIVVQAKHYINSKFAQLKHTLYHKELKKVKELKPNRYIVVTSLPLSAEEKDELKSILSPFVLTSNDIIGQEDLNSYLAEHKEIESNYFKLWFSSTNVFNSIINNAIIGRTRHLLYRIKIKIPLCVITKRLDEANKILQREKLLLITGQPGIGKTTLAEILIFSRARNGYEIFEVDNIREAEDVISVNEEHKQIFYFDDFLGANYSEIVNSHKTETQLTAFVERIKNTPNKYLILTTRTVILNQAIEKYEKISRSKLASDQFEIKLTDYTDYEKALILYNHLYFKDIDPHLRNCILDNKFYWKIISHKNYTPRIIEFFTDKSKINNFSTTQFQNFIISSLDQPKEIWRHSFSNQIFYFDRCFLVTLFTFEGGVSEETLLKSFIERLNYEKNFNNQTIYSNQFNDTVKSLLNGFITIYLANVQPPKRTYSFITPSVTDFLITYISESFQEKRSVISSLVFAEQLQRFNPEKNILILEKELQTIIRDKIANQEILSLESQNKYFTKNKQHAIYLEALCKYCNKVDIDDTLLCNLKEINFNESIFDINYKIEFVLLNLPAAPKTLKYINTHFNIIINELINSLSTVSSAENIPKIFEIYKHNYDDYVETDDNFGRIVDAIGTILASSEDDLIREREDQIKNIEEAEEIYSDLNSIKYDLESILLPTYFIIRDYNISINREFWTNKIKENTKKIKKIKKETEANYDYYKEERFESTNSEARINDLFSHLDDPSNLLE